MALSLCIGTISYFSKKSSFWSHDFGTFQPTICQRDFITKVWKQETIHLVWRPKIRLLGRWDKRLINQASDVQSIIFFHKILQNILQNPFHFFLYKITKMKINRVYEKLWKKIFGMSDASSMSCLSHRSSESAYYIADCWIYSDYFIRFFFSNICFGF